MAGDLIGHYALLKQLHMALAAASVALFATRGLGVLAGAAWPRQGAWRGTAIAIDTLLVTAGGTLWWLLGLHPARDHWLGLKLGLIVVYIGLGSLAMAGARSRTGRVLALAAALATIGLAAAVARARDPATLLRWVGLGS